MRRILCGLAATAALVVLPVTTASADPITCPPGQVATLNPSDGGWTCVNNGGNTNLSEDPRSPNKDKGDFSR
jgi:hypothetical protein